MYRRITRIAAVVVVALTSGAARQVFAIPAVEFSGTVIAGIEAGNPGSVRGWVFDVLPAGGVTISQLGLFDRGADGLGESHDVAIWNSNGTIVASGTVPAGVAAPLDANNLFRLVDILDQNLPQATGYVIGAYYSNQVDGFDSQVSGLLTHSSIRYADKRFLANVAGLTLPTTPSGQQPGYFGPSFEVVPEPSALALGFVGILASGRRTLRRFRT